MPIKNRDGTVYKLNGPNPMMDSQQTWDGFMIHNMKFRGEIAEDGNQVEPITSDFHLRDDFTAILAETKPQPEIKVTEQPKPVEIPKPVEKPKPVETPQPKIVAPVKSEPQAEQAGRKLPPGVVPVFCYCQPAVMRDRRDGVYGNKYQTIQYKEPFSFEVVIVEEDDLYIQVWTTRDIGAGSILYPRKSSDEEGKADSARWWRVQEREPRSGGWLLTGYPSDYQPSFENVR